MKSPFPGMDPYLEPRWPGLHTHLVSLAVAELNRILPEDLAAEAEERLAIESEEEFDRGVVPDVVVYQPEGTDTSEGGVAVSAPFKLVLKVEPLTERFIRIVRARDSQLVTVIEFTSPCNKTGKGLDAYHEKRVEYIASGVHVVEIDLVRRGDWRELMQPHSCPSQAVAPYRVTIRLGRPLRSAYLYPISIRQPLPETSIPLRPGDKELKLALQPLLERAYESGRYWQTIDYGRPPRPPLDGEDARWAEELLKGFRERRTGGA